MPECTQNVQTMFDQIMPYWCNYNDGSVHAFKMNRNSNLKLIAMDLGLDLESGDQIDVIVITWFKMRSTGAVPDPDREEVYN